MNEENSADNYASVVDKYAGKTLVMTFFYQYQDDTIDSLISGVPGIEPHSIRLFSGSVSPTVSWRRECQYKYAIPPGASGVSNALMQCFRAVGMLNYVPTEMDVESIRFYVED